MAEKLELVARQCVRIGVQKGVELLHQRVQILTRTFLPDRLFDFVVQHLCARPGRMVTGNGCAWLAFHKK